MATPKVNTTIEESKLVVDNDDECSQNLEDMSDVLSEVATSIEEKLYMEAYEGVEAVMANLNIIRTYLEERVK